MDADDETAGALGRTWLSDRPWEVLTRLTELDHRLAGHPGDREAASVVADAFAAAGLRDVHEEPFELRRWTPGEVELAVTVPDRDVTRSFEAVALPYCPPYDATAPLVDVGHGTPEELAAADVGGALAITSTESPPELGRLYHRVEKVGQAAAAGAEGFVFVNHVPGQLPPTGALRFGDEASIPGVGVSLEAGEWLREYADEGARVRLRVDARTEDGRSRNVVGHLGPDTDDEVLVVAHHDSHHIAEGALDNGCGVATIVGMAAMLADLERDLERRVRFASVSGEEIGLLGSEALAGSVEVDAVHAIVNVDGAGRHRDLRALTHTSGALSDVVEEIAGAVDHPVRISDGPHPYSDHWPFLRAGTPSLQLHSEEPTGEGRWERGWGHTQADTRDKADPRTIREHAMLAGLLVRAVASADLPRVDPAEVREQLTEMGAREGMLAADIWPDGWD